MGKEEILFVEHGSGLRRNVVSGTASRAGHQHPSPESDSRSSEV